MSRRRSATILSYLDYNATAPVRPEVAEAVTATLGQTGNPSSVHQAGRAARRLLERARDSVLAAAPEAVRIAVDQHGVIDLGKLAEQLETARPALVSVMLANNETGVL